MRVLGTPLTCILDVVRVSISFCGVEEGFEEYDKYKKNVLELQKDRQ